jgi:2-keto-4-pentenoate hydratase
MRALAAGGLVFTAAACAGSTLGSGVGDAYLERPPFYAGAAVTTEGRIGHLGIAYQRGATQEAMFEPVNESGSPIAALLRDMNAYLDSLGASVRVVSSSAMPARAPDVMFSCETTPDGDCATADEGMLGDREEKMRLAVARPSAEWTAWLSSTLDAAGATRALLLTLEIGDYRMTQKSWRGDKAVFLGTNYSVNVPWLTSLETPVNVLQLTGALIDREGKAVRIGAEGLLARRTRLLVSSIGGQELITDENVQQLRTARREELPGQPLVWQVALRNLVAQLTGRPEIAAR